MSFDLFAESFGNPPSSSAIVDSLRPHLIGEPQGSLCRIQATDGGEADVFVSDGGFMVSRFSGGATMRLIVHLASVHDLVLLGPELPVMLTRPGQMARLPEELAASEIERVLVESGADVEGLIAGDAETRRWCRLRLEKSAGT